MANLLEKFTVEELKQLHFLLSQNKDIIQDEIQSRNNQFHDFFKYFVVEKQKFLESITSIKKQQCYAILDKLRICDFSFFNRNLFHAPGNDMAGRMLYSSDQYLSFFESFFENFDHIMDHEGSCNTYLYLKARICDSIDEEKDVEENLASLFENIEEKKRLVASHFSKIASVLLWEKEHIPNSRVSIYNNGLSRGAHKKEGSLFTYSQVSFIDTVAFGCTLEELENENYEKIKRLIYIPQVYKEI